MLASVSTLLITVGFPNRPWVVGKGGFMRGNPRLPSINSNRAVSSPQIYAPAPRRSSTSKSKPVPKCSPRHQQACFFNGCHHRLEGEIFAADVDVAFLRANRITGDDQALKHGGDHLRAAPGL